MSADHVANINRELELFSRNGRPEVGLEVGADQGLGYNEYIQIPKCLIKQWAAHKVGSTKPTRTAADTIDKFRGDSNWITESANVQWILAHKGSFYVEETVGTNTTKIAVDDIYTQPHTYDDIRRFIIANVGHIRDNDLQESHRTWVHATRFWSVITGLVTGSKSGEYTVVDDPTGDLSAANSIADKIASLRDSALTACVARAASWRKSNHATGGELAAGFPRRWLMKNEAWTTTGDAQSKQRANRQATTAFYVATHAAMVHNVLALVAPTDECHWARIAPEHGITMNWEVKESVQLRILPKTQVAGTAIVVDAMVVLRMVAQEGLAPLLENQRQVAGLVAAHAVVAANGIKCASYANWFLDGHPDNLKRVQFNQKDASIAELVGELGAVARKYYRRSTIGESLALDNAMTQMATETSVSRWSALAQAKQTTSNAVILNAYTRITGGVAGAFLQGITSGDRDSVSIAVNQYNSVSREIATAIQLEDVQTITVDSVMRHEAATPAASDASAPAANQVASEQA